MGENQGANDTHRSSLLDKNEDDQMRTKTHLHKVFSIHQCKVVHSAGLT